MKTTQYLDAIKKRLAIGSDYGLQVPLGVSKSAVSSYRNGRSTFDHLVAARVAAILELDELQVIADMEIERAARAQLPEQRKLWERIRDAAVLAALSIGAAIVAPPPAEAATSHNQNFDADNTHCRTKRRRAAWLDAIARTVQKLQLAALCLVVVVGLQLVGCTSARADTTDAALLGGALATLTIDWAQTRAIAQNPDRFRETNPILGAHPSVGRVNSYFALAMIGTAGLAFALPREHSRIFLGGLLLLETAVIVRNDGIGMRARF